MNRTIFSLLVLLLFGLLSQPVTAQRSPQRAQQEAEKGVAKMSEAEMRALLPTLKARYEELRNIIKTGNYSQLGNDGFSEAFSKAEIVDEYICVTADINAIEKRLGKIDSQKPKPQTEQQQQAETEQQQQEIPNQNLEEEWQKRFDEKMGELQSIFNELHTDVDDHADDAKHGSVAANRVRGRINTNGFTSVTTNMLDSEQTSSPNSRQNKNSQPPLNISDKFKENKQEETKEEESEDDKRRRELIEKVQNHLNSLEKQ